MKESPLGYVAQFSDHALLVNPNSNHTNVMTDGGDDDDDTMANDSDKDKGIGSNTAGVDSDGTATGEDNRNDVTENNNKEILTPTSPVVAYAGKFIASQHLYHDSSAPLIVFPGIVSFIKCGDFQTHSAGLTDASLVLRHSIHKISVRNPASGSHYDYKMYGIGKLILFTCSI